MNIAHNRVQEPAACKALFAIYELFKKWGRWHQSVALEKGRRMASPLHIDFNGAVLSS